MLLTAITGGAKAIRAARLFARFAAAMLAVLAAGHTGAATEIVVDGGVPKAFPVSPSYVYVYDDSPGRPAGVTYRVERQGNTIDFYCLLYYASGTAPMADQPMCGDYVTFGTPGDYTVNFHRATYGGGVYNDYVLRGSVQVWIPDGTQERVAFEYYHSGLDHYFLTADADEAAALESGVIAGWTPTGVTFRVLAPPREVAGVRSVCRYYGLPSAGLDTHFFSADPVECAQVAVRWPDKWMLESTSAFSVVGPRANGYCPGVQPVVRYFNGRYDASHRYVVGDSAKKEMDAKGWIREGDAWCSDKPPVGQFSGE